MSAELSDISSIENPFAKMLLSKLNNVKFIFLIGDEIPGIQEDDGPYGYVPTKSCIYIAKNLPSIEHEMGHMLDVSIDRLTKFDFGFGTLDSFRNGCYNSSNADTFLRATAVEVRAMTIESIIHSIGNPFKPHENHFSRVEYNPFWISNSEKYLKLNSFKKFKSVKEILEWHRSIHETTKKLWTIDRIESVWNERAEYLNNWQSSSTKMQTIKMAA